MVGKQPVTLSRKVSKRTATKGTRRTKKEFFLNVVFFVPFVAIYLLIVRRRYDPPFCHPKVAGSLRLRSMIYFPAPQKQLV